MTRALGLAALFAVAASCSSKPSGFASYGREDRWTLPLVGPLEDGLLITAVTINTHGPFLFAIDPDAAISVIDGELVKLAGLAAFQGPPRTDEAGAAQSRSYAGLVNVEIGTLIIEQRDAIVVRPGTFDAAGRRIHGVLGRDILADSVVFGVDRDQGVVHLVTQKAFQAPAGAIVLQYTELAESKAAANAKVPPVPRRIVKATVNGVELAMHVDLGAPASQLRDGKWEAAKLVSREVKAAIVDELGSIRRIDKVSEPAQVAVGNITSDKVVFLPYAERRWSDAEVDGALGLGVFASHDVWQNWQTKQYLAVPRATVPVGERIGRWDSAVLGKCKSTGCITFRLVDPLNGVPPAEGKPHPGLVLSITREEVAGGMGLEVVLEGQGKADAAALPRLLVNMPPHVDRLIHQVKPDFLGTTLVVIDASPYPRACPGQNGCVDLIAR